MTKDEALKLALDWLESGNFVYPTELRTAIKEALAQPKQEPVGFAGIEMWIGNTRIKKLMTQTELHYAIDPWAIVKFNSDSCIDALKENKHD
jgi:hypothetical protein